MKYNLNKHFGYRSLNSMSFDGTNIYENDKTTKCWFDKEKKMLMKENKDREPSTKSNILHLEFSNKMLSFPALILSLCFDVFSCKLKLFQNHSGSE